MQKVLIIGAQSGIAKALARSYAARHCQLYLVARNENLLQEQKNDLEIRGAKSVEVALLDVNNFSDHAQTINSAKQVLGDIDVALICYGTLPDQKSSEHDFNSILQAMNTNALSVISLLALLAPVMTAQKSGSIAVITSVAGDRGRKSNYIYGTAKGMVSRYLQGLRASLFSHNVHVVDIKPGFVDTPMTSTFKKGALWAQPEAVASNIIKAIDKRKNVVYTPWFWRYIMLIIKIIPEPVFKRLNF